MEIDRRMFVANGAGAVAMGVGSWPALAADTEVTLETLPFSSPQGLEKPLLLDLFRPAGGRGPLPVIIFAHGGAWILGDRKTCPDLKRYFARNGFAMISIDYRLAPAHPFPAAIEDLRTAIRWVRANAGRYGLDPQRIGLWGTSAGAQLVSVAGLLPPKLYAGTEYPDHSSAVSCVLDGYGPSDLAASPRQLIEEKPRLEPVAKGVDKLPNAAVESIKRMTPELLNILKHADEAYLGGPLAANPDKVKAANPATYAHAGAPPYLIMHGLADGSVPHGQSVLLYDALVKAGADIELRLIHGLPHTFFNLPGIDDIAGPFGMEISRHRPGTAETRATETRKVFDVAHDFFHDHLMRS